MLIKMDTGNGKNQGKKGCFGAVDVLDLPPMQTFDFQINLGDVDDETKRFKSVSDAEIAEMMTKKMPLELISQLTSQLIFWQHFAKKVD